MPSRLAVLALCLSLIPLEPSQADAQTPNASGEPNVPEKIGENLGALRGDTTSTPRIDDQAWVKAGRIKDFARVARVRRDVPRGFAP